MEQKQEKTEVLNYQGFLDVWLLIKQVLDNPFLKEDGDAKLGVKREKYAMVELLKGKLKEFVMSNTIPEDGDCDTLFEILAVEDLVDRISSNDLLDFFIVFEKNVDKDVSLDILLKTPFYIEKLQARDCRKKLAILLVTMVDNTIKGPLWDPCNYGMLVKWVQGNFAEAEDLLAEVAARIMFLEKNGVISTANQHEVDVILAYKPYVNTIYGLFNEEEIEKYIKKPYESKRG